MVCSGRYSGPPMSDWPARSALALSRAPSWMRAQGLAPESAPLSLRVGCLVIRQDWSASKLALLSTTRTGPFTVSVGCGCSGSTMCPGGTMGAEDVMGPGRCLTPLLDICMEWRRLLRLPDNSPRGIVATMAPAELGARTFRALGRPCRSLEANAC